MKILTFLGVDLVQTVLRLLPFPCRTGLVRIGHPGRDSPVLLTCNFRLTVERVKRALAGTDAYLLVANSRGVNVWCAATGGLLSNHDVISVLKTSGVGELVDHRRVILPQLAATGIESRVIHDKTGWTVVWGPVRAADLPEFLARGREATPRMRRVDFPWGQRAEMAVAWAFPISLVAALAVLPFWREALLPLVGLVWGLSFLIFLSFPLYRRRLGRAAKKVGFIFFDFGRQGLPLLVWVAFVAALVGWELLAGDFSAGLTARWGLASLVVMLVLCLDLTGSTPVYKSGLHGDRLLRVRLDEARCTGAGVCLEVCPAGVFDLPPGRETVEMPRADACVHCGACIVQCPADALFFQGPDGQIVAPHTVRKFKLNLRGRRSVRSSGQ